MAKKSDQIYYETLVRAADYCCKAADYLVECLTFYHPEKILEMLEEMHRLEHEADQVKHQMSEMLTKAFVTPIDREDLAALSQEIDEVADQIEEVVQQFYIDRIASIPEDCITFAQQIARCCSLMKEMLIELPHFRKPQRLHALAIQVGDAEEDCDRLYLQICQNVPLRFSDPLDIMAWRAIYHHMESCADACSHVSDLAETIVMKNS